MAKIVVTTSTNQVKAVMNDYAAIVDLVSGGWRKADVSIKLHTDHIEVTIVHEKDWKISNSEDLPNHILQVDSVNGGAPASLQDLFDKLYTALD